MFRLDDTAHGACQTSIIETVAEESTMIKLAELIKQKQC